MLFQFSRPPGSIALVFVDDLNVHLVDALFGINESMGHHSSSTLRVWRPALRRRDLAPLGPRSCVRLGTGCRVHRIRLTTTIRPMHRRRDPLHFIFITSLRSVSRRLKATRSLTFGDAIRPRLGYLFPVLSSRTTGRSSLLYGYGLCPESSGLHATTTIHLRQPELHTPRSPSAVPASGAAEGEVTYTSAAPRYVQPSVVVKIINATG